MRSGARLSCTANPSRKNSGFQASSTCWPAGAAACTWLITCRAVPTGTVDFPTIRHADLRERQGEPEPSGIQVLAQQRLQAGLEERDFALGGLGDLLFVDVDRQYLMPEVRQADGMGQTEVPDPDNGDPSQLVPPCRECSLRTLTHRADRAGDQRRSRNLPRFPILDPPGLRTPKRRWLTPGGPVKPPLPVSALAHVFTGE